MAGSLRKLPTPLLFHEKPMSLLAPGTRVIDKQGTGDWNPLASAELNRNHSGLFHNESLQEEVLSSKSFMQKD